ncbi:MAG: folylpolyglutamate synthase/dihydrofolate synthase family protein [Syntrophales bacterium]|jgi:dihydrofolate synthase/folylpolyglutamate synthase
MPAPVEHLDGLKRLDIRFSLDPISRFLERMNNPQDAYGTVLVGGTNGKGSIAAMVASALSHGGFRVGLYTSPHLIDVRERIRIDGKMISREEMDAWIEIVKAHSTENLTYFEFLTAVAFLYFHRRKVDLAILEVGMGGRLDATNVVSPLVSVVSNISLDHTEYLGSRLEEITWEKGGIIKDGGVCITAVRQRRLQKLLEEICRTRSATLYTIGREIKINTHPDGSFSYRGIGMRYDNLVCPLKGTHQTVNAAVALGVIEALAMKGFEVDNDAVFKGIHGVKWEGRLEVIKYSPMVLLDGAHNADGASTLACALREEFSYKKLIFIFGVLKDKDYKAMLKKLLPLGDRLILTSPDTERAMPPEALLPVAKQYLRRIDVVKDSREALKRALSIADQNDLICVTGSLYLIGEIKKAFSVEFS